MILKQTCRNFAWKRGFTAPYDTPNYRKKSIRKNQSTNRKIETHQSEIKPLKKPTLTLKTAQKSESLITNH